MTYGWYAVMAALTLSVLGMMLVIGGVITSGLFLPGVVLLGSSLLGYAVAGVLHARGAGPGEVERSSRARGAGGRRGAANPA